LQKSTARPEGRKSLAAAINVKEKEVYLWAKQTDLMRIEGIDAVIAEVMVKVGIRNMADLARADAQKLKKLMDVYMRNHNIDREISPSDLEGWQKAAAALAQELVNDEDDHPLDLLLEPSPGPGEWQDTAGPVEFSGLARPKTREASFFCDMSEMMVEIGRGVALAQHELDKSSIEIQNHIDAHEGLKGYGLTATWYVMPETTLQMKVNYAVVQEEKEEGSKSAPKRMFVGPVNAKYLNYFQLSRSTESELTFKIVPIPPPTWLTDE